LVYKLPEDGTDMPNMQQWWKPYFYIHL
jgi:hypothetical protein